MNFPHNSNLRENPNPPKRRKLEHDTLYNPFQDPGRKRKREAIIKAQREDIIKAQREDIIKAQKTTKTSSCRQEMLKLQNYLDYWSGRKTPKNAYDFLIISSMPNSIHRYIK